MPATAKPFLNITASDGLLTGVEKSIPDRRLPPRSILVISLINRMRGPDVPIGTIVGPVGGSGGGGGGGGGGGRTRGPQGPHPQRAARRPRSAPGRRGHRRPGRGRLGRAGRHLGRIPARAGARARRDRGGGAGGVDRDRRALQPVQVGEPSGQDTGHVAGDEEALDLLGHRLQRDRGERAAALEAG